MAAAKVRAAKTLQDCGVGVPQLNILRSVVVLAKRDWAKALERLGGDTRELANAICIREDGKADGKYVFKQFLPKPTGRTVEETVVDYLNRLHRANQASLLTKDLLDKAE